MRDVSLTPKKENIWSSGLADQVYLAIRLSMAQEFGKSRESIPVILDDILVRFDPKRQLEAAKVILSFSNSQQVLLFTCHPEIRDIFSEASKELKLVNEVKHFSVVNGKIINV